jgi:hypothetical protein
MNGGSLVGISEQQLKEQQRVADSLIAKAEWQPRTVAPAPGELHRARLVSQVRTALSESLQDVLKKVRKDDSLLNETEHGVLYSVRRGIQIALAVAHEYRVLAGIDRIGDLSRLSNEKKTELQEKSRTASAIVLWTVATYVQHQLAGVSDEDRHGEHIELPECVFDDPTQALRCMLFYLCTNLKHPTVQNDRAVVSTVSVFFEKVLDEVEVRKETFGYLERFAEITFGVEGTDFTITGLERHEMGTSSVEFNRVEMHQIVGNADAKHFARRLVHRMLCYNFTEKKNVFVELGGFTPVWMGYGKPGTGKSMLIAAVATMFKDYCDQLGTSFLFHPLPDNLIDSYQGNSAKNMVAWMKPLQAIDKIIFAPIDDAENILEERTRQGVSEGVRAVIGVFLRYTEGAYAVNHGNATIGVFTNLPEQIDAAVRSRIQGRMVIDGAVTTEDFLDQSELWWRRFTGQDGFVNLKDPDWYEYQGAQGELKSLADAKQTGSEPEHPTMKDIFERVVREYDPHSHEFFARWFCAVVERYPAFSSRDVRNIHSAVDLRIMDFDLPEEWFERPDAFQALPYDRQKEMVLELRNANMGSLSFGDILCQEMARYLDNYARIADAQFDREVEDRVRLLRVEKEVMRSMERVA